VQRLSHSKSPQAGAAGRDEDTVAGAGSAGGGSSGDAPSDPGARPLAAGLRVLQLGPVLILVVLCIVLAALSPVFLTERNLTNLGFQVTIVAVLALGQLLVILTRGIDLSVGSVVALAGVLGAIALDGSVLSSGFGVVVTMLAVGLAVGLLNGVILVKGRILNAFIVTLGTLSIVRGVALLVADAQVNVGMPPVVAATGDDKFGPIPVPAALVLAIAVVAWVMTAKTQWGRWIYAVGGDPEGARRVGIPVDRVLISVYALSGLSAGVAAILVAGRTGVGDPNAGTLVELDAITAVIIGGASFFGGRGSVWNVLAGALIIAVMRNGLNLLGVEPFWQMVAVGALVIASLELDVLRGYLEERLRTVRAAGAP
jgi:ribose transport system permease protein